MRGLSIVATIAMLAQPALAVQPDEMLADPEKEARARAISAGLRCLVCRNESIDDSNAELARDLRLLVRERISSGDSDAEATDYIRKRYGDFVLLKPPVKPATWLLWFGPFLLLFGVSFILWRQSRHRGKRLDPTATPLTAAEQARLETLLAQEEERKP